MRSRTRGRPGWRALLGLAGALWGGGPALGADTLIERILAVVEGRPVLLSEVRLLQAVRGLDERTALEALIDERLMMREAGRLAQSAVSADEEERGLEQLRSTSAAAREAPAHDLRRLVRRQTAIVKYIDFRFRPQVSASVRLPVLKSRRKNGTFQNRTKVVDSLFGQRLSRA